MSAADAEMSPLAFSINLLFVDDIAVEVRVNPPITPLPVAIIFVAVKSPLKATLLAVRLPTLVTLNLEELINNSPGDCEADN